MSHWSIFYPYIEFPKISYAYFKIKEYGYRSDGLKYWAAIKKYVRGIVDIFYDTDKERIQPINSCLIEDTGLLNLNETVQNDNEIQNWIFEVRKFGFENVPNAIPKSIDTVKELEKILTSIIFNCSVQHTGQRQIYNTI